MFIFIFRAIFFIRFFSRAIDVLRGEYLVRWVCYELKFTLRYGANTWEHKTERVQLINRMFDNVTYGHAISFNPLMTNGTRNGSIIHSWQNWATFSPQTIIRILDKHEAFFHPEIDQHWKVIEFSNRSIFHLPVTTIGMVVSPQRMLLPIELGRKIAMINHGI